MLNDSPEWLLQQAREALSRREYPDARKFYELGLDYAPDSPELHYGIATVCFLLGDLQGAANHFQETIRLDPAQALAHVNLGAIYNRMGQYEDSLVILRRGIELDGSRSEGYYNLGLAYKHFGELDLAAEAYREALRLNPRMFEAHLNLGNIYHEKKEFAQAIIHYRKALEIRPNCGKAPALEAAQAELAKMYATAANGTAPAPAAPKVSKPDLTRTIDPEADAKILRELHHMIIELDSSGRTLLDLLRNQIEAAIRDLSISIMKPTGPALPFDEQVKKFDEVVEKLRVVQEVIQQRVVRTKAMGEELMGE
jgi:tetratricopeptide (TPR) repeat protein